MFSVSVLSSSRIHLSLFSKKKKKKKKKKKQQQQQQQHGVSN
jgi:hypothetical protein